MAQTSDELPDVASWELVCFCLYTEHEKRELLGHPRLPMRTIDEIFLCRAILGKLFRISDDCRDLQHRLRTSGFSDDLNTLTVLPYSQANLHKAYERAMRSLKPSYKNDEKDVNERWYRNHSFSIEVLMKMTENTIDSRRKSTGHTDCCESAGATDNRDIVHELEPPQKKRKPNEIVLQDDVPQCSSNSLPTDGFSHCRKDVPTGILQNSYDEKPRASSLATKAAAAPKSVPITPLRDEREGLHNSHSALCPKIIDLAKSHDNDEDDDDVVEVLEEPMPSAVRIPFSQEEDDVAAPDSGEPTSFLSSKDCNLLDSPDKEEHCQAFSKFKITLVVSSIVLLGTMLLVGWHNAGFWSEQQPNPWRVSFFSREAMHRPRIDPIQTMTTLWDANPGPWQERDEGVGSGMTNPGSKYLPRP